MSCDKSCPCGCAEKPPGTPTGEDVGGGGTSTPRDEGGTSTPRDTVEAPKPGPALTGPQELTGKGGAAPCVCKCWCIPLWPTELGAAIYGNLVSPSAESLRWDEGDTPATAVAGVSAPPALGGLFGGVVAGSLTSLSMGPGILPVLPIPRQILPGPGGAAMPGSTQKGGVALLGEDDEPVPGMPPGEGIWSAPAPTIQEPPPPLRAPPQMGNGALVGAGTTAGTSFLDSSTGRTSPLRSRREAPFVAPFESLRGLEDTLGPLSLLPLAPPHSGDFQLGGPDAGPSAGIGADGQLRLGDGYLVEKARKVLGPAQQRCGECGCVGCEEKSLGKTVEPPAWPDPSIRDFDWGVAPEDGVETRPEGLSPETGLDDFPPAAADLPGVSDDASWEAATQAMEAGQREYDLGAMRPWTPGADSLQPTGLGGIPRGLDPRTLPTMVSGGAGGDGPGTASLGPGVGSQSIGGGGAGAVGSAAQSILGAEDAVKAKDEAAKNYEAKKAETMQAEADLDAAREGRSQAMGEEKYQEALKNFNQSWMDMKEAEEDAQAAAAGAEAAIDGAVDAYDSGKDTYSDQKDYDKQLNETLARYREQRRDEERREANHLKKLAAGSGDVGLAKLGRDTQAQARTGRDAATSSSARMTQIRNDLTPSERKDVRDAEKAVKEAAKEAKKAGKAASNAARYGVATSEKKSEDAQKKAGAAQQKAGVAQKKADAAREKQKAAEAKGDKSKAASAKNKADKEQAKADTAKKKADKEQAKADAAKKKADAAKKKADANTSDAAKQRAEKAKEDLRKALKALEKAREAAEKKAKAKREARDKREPARARRQAERKAKQAAKKAKRQARKNKKRMAAGKAADPGIWPDCDPNGCTCAEKCYGKYCIYCGWEEGEAAQKGKGVGKVPSAIGVMPPDSGIAGLVMGKTYALQQAPPQPQPQQEEPKPPAGGGDAKKPDPPKEGEKPKQPDDSSKQKDQEAKKQKEPIGPADGGKGANPHAGVDHGGIPIKPKSKAAALAKNKQLLDEGKISLQLYFAMDEKLEKYGHLISSTQHNYDGQTVHYFTKEYNADGTFKAWKSEAMSFIYASNDGDVEVHEHGHVEIDEHVAAKANAKSTQAELDAEVNKQAAHFEDLLAKGLSGLQKFFGVRATIERAAPEWDQADWDWIHEWCPSIFKKYWHLRKKGICEPCAPAELDKKKRSEPSPGTGQPPGGTGPK